MRRPTDNYILTRADAERISDVVRNAEQRIGHIKARHRRRVVASGGRSGGGTPVIWGKIIETLACPDPEGTPEEGTAQYKVRIILGDIDVWEAGEYPPGAVVLYPDDEGLAYQQAGDEPTENEPPDAPWVLADVSPRPLGQEANYEDLINEPPDMRLFVPWYQVGDIVPLVRRVVTVGEGESEETETLYFFDLQMTRVAEALDGVQSVAWNADEHRLMAVFGDVETEFEGD